MKHKKKWLGVNIIEPYKILFLGKITVWFIIHYNSHQTEKTQKKCKKIMWGDNPDWVAVLWSGVWPFLVLGLSWPSNSDMMLLCGDCRNPRGRVYKPLPESPTRVLLRNGWPVPWWSPLTWDSRTLSWELSDTYQVDYKQLAIEAEESPLAGWCNRYLLSKCLILTNLTLCLELRTSFLQGVR